MKRTDPFAAWAFAAAALLLIVVVVHLRFIVLPAAFLALGFVTYAWNGRKALLLFLLLLPLVNSTPDLFFNGYPFNYMGIPLFHLAGMLCASLIKKEHPDTTFPGRGPYLLFLSLLGISVVFVFLRWSNLGLSALAFLRDTPVAPSMERVSFACIFPAITLALFSLAPWAAFLLRHWRLREAEVFVPLKVGLFLSFLLALGQKWIDPGFMSQSWWGLTMKQLNGGFSDFNAFGFFAGAMFLYQALKLMERLPVTPHAAGTGGVASASRRFSGGILAAELLFLAVALAAVLISGCRSAFLFVLAALLRLFLSRRPGWRLKAAAVVLLAAALLIAGGTLGRRLRHSLEETTRLSSIADLSRTVDEVSNNRLEMLRDGGRMIGRFPGSGVGAGNFLFALKYLRFGEDTWLDLPLNQYLLVFSETGLAGGLAFLLFMAALLRRQKPGNARFILATMAFALLFNNFFWFPEVLLLFWIFVARADLGEARPWRKSMAWGAVLILSFIVMNIAAFRALHPTTWAAEKGTAYDYGFSYQENDGDRSFRWSNEKAGIYVFLDKATPRVSYKLACGAPLSYFPGKMQRVEVYWRGRPLRRIVFRKHGDYVLHLQDEKHLQGFLEFRVQPAFNLKQMGLGAESRDLGVKVFSKTAAFTVDGSGKQLWPDRGCKRVDFTVEVSEKRKDGNHDYHFLRGWIFIDDEETEGQEVFVVVTKPDGSIMRYSAISEKRADVAANFKNIRYNAAGFSALIPLEDDMDIHSCTIRFEVENKHGICKSAVWKTASK